MTDPRLQKPGRHAEIVPQDGSHYVVVDGIPWSRHDELAKAESVRSAIVERWAAWYEAKAAESTMQTVLKNQIHKSYADQRTFLQAATY